MNVLIIPEDFRKDQYMLKPLVAALFKAKNKSARIVVCQDPLLGGIAEALKWERMAEIIDRYWGMVDLYLLCVDRDGQPGRQAALHALEERAAAYLPANRYFLTVQAWQEIEVWVLAGLSLPTDWVWQTIRQEPNPKEVYFLPLAIQRGLLSGPGQGRKALAQEAAHRYDRIRQLCTEVIELEARV